MVPHLPFNSGSDISLPSLLTWTSKVSRFVSFFVHPLVVNVLTFLDSISGVFANAFHSL